METTNDILSELLDISPLLAGIPKGNLFTTPQGYFDTISITVLACLQEEKAILPTIDLSKSTDIPPGYFDSLSSTIIDKIRMQETAGEELARLSPMLQTIQKENVFKVTAGYFESFSSILLEKIPDIAKTDKDELSPLLESVRKVNVFTVPAGYFVNLAAGILQKLKPHSSRVVTMPKRSLVIRYAAAAMITGIIAFGIYTQTGKPGTPAGVIASTEVLEATVELGKNMNDQQYTETLNNLTEEDIASYLEKNGDIADITTLSNTIEENKLPTRDDYLLDAKTLENYLNAIESTSANN